VSARGLAIMAFVVSVGPVAGCAYGRHLHYDAMSPFVEQGRSISLALAVQDQRDSVLSGGRADFVGLSRGGFGNSFDITTASGQPLAADFAVSIARGLQAAGYRVTIVRVMERSRPETVARALVKTGAERLLAIQIDVWKSDAYFHTRLYYGVTLRVLDAQGQELGRATVAGSDVVAHNELGDALGRAYVEKLEGLLNHPAVKRALAPGSTPVTPPSVAPSVAPPPGEPAVIVPSP
jgi:hypothetical protein